MSVGSHLQIHLDEYDSRIRTFIPGYEQLLASAAEALRTLPTSTPHVVDLGTGTGALAARCFCVVPGAHFTAVDEDADILRMAELRLGSAGALASFVQGSFLDVELPACDAIVASLALHHVRTADRKQRLYADCRAALGPGGLLVTADCCPSADPALDALERAAWRTHLRATYSDAETDGYFAAWAHEDVYLPLSQELRLLGDAGLRAEVLWRQGPFAVVAARKA